MAFGTSGDFVEYNILINAVKAMKELRELTQLATSFDQKVATVTARAKLFGSQWGMSTKAVVSAFRELDEIMDSSGKGSVLFGQMHKQGWHDVGQAAQDASKKSVRSIDAIRIALGALVAMLIFNVIQVIQNTFREFIGNLRETELAVYNLINAERKLSEAGVDITPKGLQEIIDSVREILPILSQIDAEELVSRIASNVAPSLKLTREEMEKLAKTIALAYAQNKALGYSFDELEKSFTDSVLTGKVSQGINKYGVKIDDLIIKQHAVKMGLVESEEAFDDLTAEMQAHIQAISLIDYAYQEFSKNAESIDEYMETTDAQIERTSKAWSDLLTVLGTGGAGVWLAKAIGFVAGILEAWVEIFEYITPAMMQFFAVSIAGFRTLGYVVLNPMTGLIELHEKFVQFKNEALDQMMMTLATATDTATAAQEGYNDAVADFDAEGFGNKIEDIIEDLENAREDLADKFQQKQDDIDLEYLRKAEDAERDYLRKVEDINRDAERDLAALREEHRQEDAQAEAEYQNQLWELRMRFLMDLEEALHARDARQVIRLQKQYEIDKEALERKQTLEDEQREQQQQNEIEDIELRRQQRIEDAQLEYQQKLYDQQLAKQRELDDLNVWYAREQADLEQATQRKLETLIKGWIDEKKITEQNAAEVYGILAKYFGPGGMTDALYQYMMQSLIAASSIPIGYVSAYGNLGGGVGGGSNTAPLSQGSTGGRPMAEGGTLLATRPTTVTFGEAGDELATFTPLNRIGRNVGKLFGDLSSGSRDGQIVLDITLSPDLEARIIENSMDGVGEIIARVNRSKV